MRYDSPRVRTALGGRALAILLSVAAMLAYPIEEAGAFNAPKSYLRFWASTNGGGSSLQRYSLEEAREVARRYDVVVALKTTFKDQVAAMREVNPRLVLISYMNGSFATPAQDATFPGHWYLRDASGAKVRSTKWGNYMMDVRQQGWREYAAEECRNFLQRSGFDGCYLDSLGAGNLRGNLTGTPINPRTGREYTEWDWLTDTSALAAFVNDQFEDKLIVSNGLNNGNRYGDPSTGSHRLLAASDGGNAEGWLRGAASPVDSFKNEGDWKSDVDLLVDAGEKSKSVMAMTKIWIPASPEQIEQWRSYAYASFLLGTNGRQFLYFNPAGPGKPPAAHPLDRIDIGAPLADYAKKGGAYRRDFKRGVALVNPTDVTVTVPLGGTFFDIDGNAHTAVRLRPHTGTVLSR